MGYYMAGDYYRAGARGDYYRAGSIFSAIGNVVGKVAGAVSPVISMLPGGSLVGGALGLAGRALSSSTTPTSMTSTTARVTAAAGLAPRLTAAPPKGKRDEPGLAGTVHRLLPGGHSGYLSNRRHMQVTNQKALKRAERRIRGFEKVAKRALRPLGLHVTRQVCKHTHPFARRKR